MKSSNPQIATITGAGRGSGKATALKLGRSGKSLYITDIDSNLLEESLSDLNSEGIEATGGVFDSSDITGYDNYLITVENVITGSGNIELLLYVSVDNGSNYLDSSGDYRFISFNGIENESNNSFTSRYSASTNKIGITGNYSNNGNDAALKIDATVECFSLTSTSYKKFIIRSMFGQTDDPPKLVWTKTPTVKPPACLVNTRDDVPIPPLYPNALVPVPAPIEPSVTSPDLAFLIAFKTCVFVTWRPWISFNPLSFVSPTTGFTDLILGLSIII